VAVEPGSPSAAPAATCSCGSSFDVHPTPECSDPHAPGEFDVFGHAQRVAANFPMESVEYEVALYHDHLEDDLGPVPDTIRHHVEVLTRGEVEDYKAYIERVRTSGDPVAIAVKIADASDNLARCEGHFDGYVNSNLGNRYRYVLKELRRV
jgi:hypothetical protein